MKTFHNKHLAAVILIAVVALLVIAVAWSAFFYDGKTPPPVTVQTTPVIMPAQTTESSGMTEETTNAVTSSDTPKPTGKVIALTFDDGPSKYTEEILDLLEQYNAKATFFVNGYQLGTARANTLRRMVSLGCEIGNHTTDHERLTALSAEEIYDQLERVNDMVQRLCGYRITLMRPPGGHTSASVMQAMYDSGLRMKTILWNNDSLDWSFNSDYLKGEITREEAVRKTYDMICGYPLDGAIVLMHDIKEITPDALELLLQKLVSEGYTFVTVSEMYDFEKMGEDLYFSKFYSQYQIECVK